MIQRHLAPFLKGSVRTRWVLNVDLDEFAYARESGRLPSTTLWHFLTRQPPSVRGIFLPWKAFGAVGSTRPAGSISLHAVHRFPRFEPDCKWIARSDTLMHHAFHQHDLNVRSSAVDACPTILPDLSCFTGGDADADGTYTAHGTRRDADGANANFSIHINHYQMLDSRQSYLESKFHRGNPSTPRTYGSWQRFESHNGKAAVVDVELREKRLSRMEEDQTRLDELMCASRHAGGSLPVAWCAPALKGLQAQELGGAPGGVGGGIAGKRDRELQEGMTGLELGAVRAEAATVKEAASRAVAWRSTRSANVAVTSAVLSSMSPPLPRRRLSADDESGGGSCLSLPGLPALPRRVSPLKWCREASEESCAHGAWPIAASSAVQATQSWVERQHNLSLSSSSTSGDTSGSTSGNEGWSMGGSMSGTSALLLADLAGGSHRSSSSTSSSPYREPEWVVGASLRHGALGGSWQPLESGGSPAGAIARSAVARYAGMVFVGDSQVESKASTRPQRTCS